MTSKDKPKHASDKHVHHKSSHHDDHKDDHKNDHKKHNAHSGSDSKKKKSRPNYLLGAAVFVVLVLLVYGIIVFLNRAGEMRSSPDAAAMVNDEPITMEYLNEQYGRIPAEYKAYVTKPVLLNQTINEMVLLQEAKKEGITVSDEDIDAQIVTAMQQAGIDREQLKAKLAEQNLTEEFLKKLYRKQLTINALLEAKVFSHIEVTEQEKMDHYDNLIHAAHILVTTKEEAEDMIIQLQRTSRDGLTEKFFELAQENSIDPSAKTNKGDLGEFGKGMMVPEFEAAAFALEPGEFTTSPVKTQFGYHVILRLEKDKSFDEQKAEIGDLLLTQKKSTAVPLYVEQLRNKAKIEVFYTGEPAEGSKE